MNNIGFNDHALDAAMILLAKEEMAKLIAKLFKEVLAKIHEYQKEDFKLVLERFARIGEHKVANGKQNELMRFVECLRNYRPMYQPEEYKAFSEKAKGFAIKLRIAANATYGANPSKWYEKNKEYMNEAMRLNVDLATTRLLRDQNTLEDLIVRWNEIAVKWKTVIDKEFPVEQPTTTQ